MRAVIELSVECFCKRDQLVGGKGENNVVILGKTVLSRT